MTKRIIQKDTYSCFACVAAMITGETVVDVFNFVGHDGSGFSEKSTHPEKCVGFGWIEMLKYLIEHRYTIGSWAAFDDPSDISQFSEIHFEIIMNSSSAIIEVVSKRLGGGCSHVIYWNGNKIYDPSPAGKESPSFSDYGVLKFIPVIHFE